MEVVANEGYWPLHKRVEELLHMLVTMHRTVPSTASPEFRVYKSTSKHFDWLEHPGIAKHKNRISVQMEDIRILLMRKLVEVTCDRRDDKTFDLTTAGLDFHDQHCKQETGS